MLKKILTKLCLVFLTVIVGGSLSCSRTQTLNLRPFQYTNKPKTIIWFQVEGLAYEHFTMEKLMRQNEDGPVSFEKMSCPGMIWGHNLLALRPSPRDVFLAQMTGSKAVNGSCEDYSLPAFWRSDKDVNKKVIVLESGIAEDESFLKSKYCEDAGQDFLKGVSFYSMAKKPKDLQASEDFHYQDKIVIKEGIFFDKSCQKGICQQFFLENIKKIITTLFQNNSSFVVVIRDGEFANLLKRHEVLKARERLSEIEAAIQWVQAYLEKQSDMLVLLSGAGSLPIELPRKGDEWKSFVNQGKKIVYHNTSLLNPILAMGANAENFCGMFDMSQVYKRIYWQPEGPKIRFDFFQW